MVFSKKIPYVFSLLLISSLLQAEKFFSFQEIKLVANNASFGARNIDPRLINPWGLTFNSHGNLIVADNDSSVLATSYAQDGSTLGFTINGSFNPTGLETNNNKRDFIFGANQKPARLLFSTEQGTIMAFNKKVDPNNAQIVIDRSSFNSVYKGLALAYPPNWDHQYIFAADFLNAKVDVFDHNFNFIKSFTGPNLPAGFAPFNIQNLGGCLYVSYALQNPEEPEDDLAGPGNGFVDIFDTDGHFIKRLISHGALNSPWGLVIAPEGFGNFGGALLVGNFGDGRINAYDAENGDFLGTLRDKLGDPIVIEGLWAIQFDCVEKADEEDEENVEKSERNNLKLFFTSGPNDESDGLIGAIISDCEREE